jgi:hypothetical protein
MIYQSTLDTLTEDEMSILYLICNNFLARLDIEMNYTFIRMLRVDVVLKMIDVLKLQAKEECREIFDSLKKKLCE